MDTIGNGGTDKSIKDFILNFNHKIKNIFNIIDIFNKIILTY
ncbi:protein of unknown function [Tepidibacter aestuarii]|nr:protein of unknown function [Tepidibacter aestuarii]